MTDNDSWCCCRWCCNPSPVLSFCRRCGLCCECCLCLPPPPPPVRYIREQVQVPCPYPAYNGRDLCCCPTPPVHDPCCYPAPDGSYYPPSFYLWLSPKRIYQAGQSVMPGYKGHIPGFKFHSAGRTFGSATRDTRCIMSQWPECCPVLPCRIWEQ